MRGFGNEKETNASQEDENEVFRQGDQVFDEGSTVLGGIEKGALFGLHLFLQ